MVNALPVMENLYHIAEQFITGTEDAAMKSGMSPAPSPPSWETDFLKGILQPVASLAIVALAMALSAFQDLRLEWDMAYAITRSFLQLTLIGFVLQLIFTSTNNLWILLAYMEMVLVAGYTAGQRAKKVPQGQWVATVAILAGTGVTLALLLGLRVFPFSPRYIIPTAGMLVGNAMTTVGVTMKRVHAEIVARRAQVEVSLALGATPRQATKQLLQQSLVLALAPVIDNAKTVGLISLPGAMTGLIMGGQSPIAAVQLQIVVMSMLMGAALFCSLLAALMSWPLFFTRTSQLKYELLS